MFVRPRLKARSFTSLAAIVVPVLVLAAAVAPAMATAKVPVLTPKYSLLLEGKTGNFNSTPADTYCKSSYPADGGRVQGGDTPGELTEAFDPPWTRGTNFVAHAVDLNVVSIDCPSGRYTYPSGWNGYNTNSLLKTSCQTHRLVRLFRDGAEIDSAYTDSRARSIFEAPPLAPAWPHDTFLPGYYTAIAPQAVFNTWLQKRHTAPSSHYYKVTVKCTQLKVVLGQPAPWTIVHNSY